MRICHRPSGWLAGLAQFLITSWGTVNKALMKYKNWKFSNDRLVDAFQNLSPHHQPYPAKIDLGGWKSVLIFG